MTIEYKLGTSLKFIMWKLVLIAKFWSFRSDVEIYGPPKVVPSMNFWDRSSGAEGVLLMQNMYFKRSIRNIEINV